MRSGPTGHRHLQHRRRRVFSLDTFSDTVNIATGVSILTRRLATVFGPLEAFLKTTSLDVRQRLGTGYASRLERAGADADDTLRLAR